MQRSSARTRCRHTRLRIESLERRDLLAIFLDPVVAASIHDQPRDGIGDSFNESFPTLIRQLEIGSIEDRAIVEFDLQGINEPINLVALDLRIYGQLVGPEVRTFDLIGYAANGAADLADFNAPGSLIRTVSYLGAQASSTYRLDVTSVVQQFLAAGATHFGLRVDSQIDVGPSHVVEAKLSINGLPAPTGRRGWETVPNAIRADGTEAFRVEVDLHSEVRDVTLTPWLNRFGTEVMTLRDDGQSGDRVAGDFVFTSQELRYNTAVPFPTPFFANDPDSPPGVAIEDVGTILVTELDGTTSEFLIRPQVGLLRPDLAEVPTQTLSDELVISDHVVNVRSQSQATQRSLRGSENLLAGLTEPIIAQLGDAFDFFAFFSTNKLEDIPRLSGANFHAGKHVPVQIDFTGTGVDPFDTSAGYGSDGQLLGLALLDTLSRGIWDANFTHELLHQWAARLPPSLGISDGGHFFTNASVGSLIGGQEWIPNGDGSYTVNYDEGRARGATHASPLDKYLMGLVGPADVPPIHVFNPAAQPRIDLFNPYIPASEVIDTVTIEEIVDAVGGVRSPGPDAAQRAFRIGFVAESHNRWLTPTEMTFYEIFAANYAKTLPADEPDPHIDFGWASITRFFGSDTTWTTLLPGRSEASNQPPVAASADWEIPETAAIGQIVGTVSASDPDPGQSLVFAIAEGADDAEFLIDANTGEITVNRPLDQLASDEYQLRIVVSDTGIPSQYDSTIITIRLTSQNVTPPVITPGQSFPLAEHASSGTVVGTVQVFDPDPGTVLQGFTLTAGNEDGAFVIDSATGRITVADSAKVDYDTLATRTFMVQVSDGFHTSAPQSVQVLLSDINDNAPVIASDQVFVVDENAAAGVAAGLVLATDRDTVGSLQGYTIVGGNADSAFAINAMTGEIRVASGGLLDYETAPSRTLEVRVSDGVHDSALAAVLIEIANRNDAPTVAEQNWLLGENSPAGTPVGTVVATDQDADQQLAYRIAAGNDLGAFAIDPATGLVTVSNPAAIDYEVRPVFSLQVEVSDNGSPSLTSTGMMTVRLTDVLELAIDIKPNDPTNTINLRNESKIAVAILSSTTFNAITQIDVGSLTFGKTGNENSLVRHRKTGNPQVDFKDVNGDGLLDLVVYFDTGLTGLRVGDTQATLKGRLTSGASFVLTAPVIVVSSKR